MSKNRKKISSYGAKVVGDLAKVLGVKSGTRMTYPQINKHLWKVIKPTHDTATNTYNLSKTKFAKEFKNIYGKNKIKMTEVGKVLGNKKFVVKDKK